MKISPLQLAKRVERWQRRLAQLGVSHWRILSVSLCDETPSGPDADASVWVPDEYDNVRFYFTHSFLEESDDRDLDETIIHEWLHVAMRDMDIAIQAAEEWMPNRTYHDFVDSVKHHKEGFIDRTARTIYAQYSKNK